MPEKCEDCKTPQISNPAKILRAYMACSGVTDVKQLAADLDIPVRTIQRLKLEAATAIYGAAKDAKRAIYGVSDAPKTPNTPYMAQEQCTESRARAYKESPSEISISKNSLDSPLAPQAVVVPLKPKANRGSRLANEWTLPDDWMMWARTNFPASTIEQITTEAAKFRDYWVAKPGAQACKLDWEATWRNWCRTGLSQAGMRRPQSTGVYHAQPKVELDWDAINAYAERIG